MLVQSIIDHSVRTLALRAEAVFVRAPAIDPNLPDSSDIDLLAFSDVDDLYPERLAIADETGARQRMVDVTWLPGAWLDDPDTLAMRGLIAHRLATSTCEFGAGGRAAAQCATAVRNLYRRDIHERRVSALLEMGALTVREIGITWDFPGIAMFWLHIAHASCLAAAVDGLRGHCPNVYTRPFEYLPLLEKLTASDLSGAWTRALRLGVDPAPVAAAVRRAYEAVTARFPEPAWPSDMRATTRFEYRYWTSRDEMEWRLAVAEEMDRQGQRAAAVFYLRFYAYALARAPMVHARALEGRDVSYLRPEKAVRPDLERLCPEILDDLNVIFTGTRSPTVGFVESGLASVHAFRDRVVDTLTLVGAPVPKLVPWTPFLSTTAITEIPCQT